KDMPGVATAMEPPHLSLVSSGGKYYGTESSQSFGSYRAQLIFMALDRTKSSRPNQSDSDRFEAFKHRVEKYFRQAGIDPDNPAEQSAPLAYLPLEDLDVDIEVVKPATKQDVGKAKVHIKH
ncbi:MAG TPA: T3SS effector HopA1 family protein, partial [Pseudomonadales bacterium]|nr:T3SS effector HopA1 family protein [Pseudomonadales bacterium]